jgi:hypothetical protein
VSARQASQAQLLGPTKTPVLQLAEAPSVYLLLNVENQDGANGSSRLRPTQ